MSEKSHTVFARRLKVLVFCQKTKLPLAIQKCIEALGGLAIVHVGEGKKPNDIQQLLKSETPSLVLIDGEYGLLDGERWKALSELSPTALRLKLITGKELPESLVHLKYFHALKAEGVKIGIFIDEPSDALVEELGRIGATFVHRSLNKISSLESSIFEVVQGSKEIADAVVEGGKKFGAGLKKIGTALLSKKK